MHSRWRLRGSWIRAIRKNSHWHRLIETSMLEIVMGYLCGLTRQDGDGLKVGRVAFAQSDCNRLQAIHGQDQDDGKEWMHRAID